MGDVVGRVYASSGLYIDHNEYGVLCNMAIPQRAIDAMNAVMCGDGMKHGARSYVKKCKRGGVQIEYLLKAMRHINTHIERHLFNDKKPPKDKDSGQLHLANAMARIACVIESLTGDE